MAISIYCNSCNKTYQLDERFARKQVRCPNGHIIIAALPPKDEPAPSSLTFPPSGTVSVAGRRAASRTTRHVWIVGAILMGATGICLVCLVAWLAIQSKKHADPRTPDSPNWTTSWEAFAREISPYLKESESPLNPAVTAKFDGKQVVWEGEVAEINSKGNAILVNVAPQTFTFQSNFAVGGRGTVVVKRITVIPKKDSLPDWRKVTPGTKVKFQGILKQPIYLVMAIEETRVVESVFESTRGIVLTFKVRQAEPILQKQ